MKYIFKYLIPEYYSILNGNITLNGQPLPVVDDMASAPQSTPYILLGDRTSFQRQDKSGFLSEITLLVDVVVKGDNFGQGDAEDAANQIMALINSDNNPDLSPDFKVVTTSIQSTNNLSTLSPTDRIFRTLIRFRHIVKEL